jgi:hypothetical protein
MRYNALLASLSILLTAACDPVPFDQAQKDAIATEVEETLAGLTEAMNAHDSDRVFAYFRNSEEFLYLGCTDFLIGWDAYSRRAGPYYAANPDATVQQGVVRTQVLSPTVAVVALRGSSTLSEALFWTEVLVKEDGRWVIAHEHESWPGCSPPSEPHPFTTMEEMPGMAELDSIGSGKGAGGP